MRWGIALSVCVILLLSTPILAQDADSGRPVIDPATIFAPGVDVAETLPVLNYDNDARLVWYFDPQKNDWQSYKYPSDLDQIQDYQRRSDGTYLLSNNYYEGIAGAIWDQVWLFVPAAGLIEHPPKICGLVQFLTNEGQWRLTKLDDGLYHLCNTETGKLSEPLPADLQTSVDKVCFNGEGTGVPVTSPDEKWVVFYSCYGITSPPIYTVYSYEVSGGLFNRIGSTEIAQYINIADWIDDTHPLIRVGDVFEGGSHEVYVGDVTTNDSLKQIADQYSYKPILVRNPDRLFWISFDWAENKDAPKSLKQYDFSSGETKLLWRRSCELECEATDVVWADNDLVVLLDGYPMSVEFRGIFWSLKTGKLLYSVVNTYRIYPLNNHTFLFNTFDESVNSTVFRGVQFQNGTVREIVYPDASTGHPRDIYVSPSREYLLIVKAGYQVYGADVYDLVNQRRYVLTQDLGDEYSYNIQWANNSLLQIDVLKQVEACGYERCIFGSWLVRIPDESAVS
ncbi:MAG: hypothetical protein ABI690_34935 [Chloroflexota bacterium]